MRLFVVNVGVNTADASRRALQSPVFPDSTFEFVPIKEDRAFAGVDAIPRYCDLPTVTGRARSLAAYVPNRLAHYRVHADPEFNTYTYGDILSPRAANLRDAEEGSLIWFLARLWNHDGSAWLQGSDFYFIGFFEIEHNILIKAGIEPDRVDPHIRSRIQENAHYKRWIHGNDRTAFRVITGQPIRSFRFQRALRVTADVAGHLFAATYDPRSDIFLRDGRVIANLNGRPRRFGTFGSITRSVQAFLDSALDEHGPHIAALTDIAAAHRGNREVAE